MTLDAHAQTVEGILTRDFAVVMSPENRTLVERRVADAMAAETVRRRSPARRFSLRRGGLIAVGLLLASGLATAVGAGTHVIRLEWGSLPEQQRTATQINAEIADAMRVTPLPPGATFPPMSVPDDGSVWGSHFGQQMVEWNAMCAWYGDWTSAFAQGDRERLARDRTMMDAFLSWKTIADPFLADGTVRDLLHGLNADADAGNPRPIQQFRANNCSAP